MPQLIKKVEGIVYSELIGNVTYLKPIIGDIQRGDYIKLFSFTGYLQNFSRIEQLENLIKPLNFGLVNKYNVPIVTLEIDY